MERGSQIRISHWTETYRWGETMEREVLDLTEPTSQYKMECKRLAYGAGMLYCSYINLPAHDS